MASITPQQRRKIFALCRELGWSDDFRRDMLNRWIGKPSLAADAERPINHIEAIELITHLNTAIRKQQTGRAASKRRRRRTWPDHQPTPEQLHRIDKLRSTTFGEATPAFRSWLNGRWQVEDPRWLTPKQAGAVIQALNAMQRSGWKPANTPSGSESPRDTSDERSTLPHDSPR